jgi:hypothetical protein
VTEYAVKHMPPKLVGGLRSVAGLHNAICGDKVSTTNGLLAQYADHKPKECPICLKAVQGVLCAACNKSWVELGHDGKPTEYCKGCAGIGAVERARRKAAPGSHAERNPELHDVSRMPKEWFDNIIKI